MNKEVVAPVNQEMIELIQNNANRNKQFEDELAGINKLSDDV